MVGGLVCGHIADVTGPRTTMIFTLYSSIILGVMLYLVESFTLFMFIRFIIGFMMQGLQISVFVLAVELCATSKNRALTAAIFESHWAFGVMILAAIAYIFQAWRNIQLTISLLILLSLTFVWFIPESLRWLINHQRFKESLAYMKKAAKINKVVISSETEAALRQACGEEKRDRMAGSRRYTLWHAFKTPNLRKHTLVMFYVWLATSLGYYGLSLQASKFTGNKYLNFFINGAIELPAYLLGIWIIGYIGRRIPLCVYFIIGGVACILAGTIPKQTTGGRDISWISTMLAWIGKFSTAGCWSVLFLYASEIFPSSIRNAGTGACTIWARVGSFVAPQINLIAKYSHHWIPFVVFGAVSLLGGLLALLLPETKNESLPDTFEEAENIGKRHGKHFEKIPHEIPGEVENLAADVEDATRL
ncbi:hypothetical protein LSH36_550g03002 [Paralvinella palmiformis]|uniref:Major facilitator superfamily (MFS) profile domain-containing protein n=1 Tax=Paralvinella palmiformis TaxID=53620 RepID=A0AAD9J796_9ANNE|nr:hypothetical protein LSH36_550g03002 [Paralvinella palmiformis]